MFEARSTLEDFAAPSQFEPVVIDRSGAKAKKAILCSGKLAYEVARQQAKHGTSFPIVRLEQLYPFPQAEIDAALRGLGVSEFQWLQEEPANFGAALWLGPRLDELARRLRLKQRPAITRPESASPAGSFHGWHERDQQQLILQALQLESRNNDEGG